MSLITVIDQSIKKLIYSIFWRFIDPLESDRLYGQLVDVMERHIDANDPEKLIAPDHFQIFVNNTVFIKHAHAVKKIEAVVRDRLQKYVANKDYELAQPKIDLQIISSATVQKKDADIRCWFSSEEEASKEIPVKKYTLKVVSGEGKGLSWSLQAGKSYQIGRLSSCDICLPFENISKKQAELQISAEGKLTLLDKGSTNGTFINDEKSPLQGKREIVTTDNIRLCKLNPITLILTTQ